MRKTITYTSFAVASLIVVTIFLTSKTYTQLIIGILLYTPLVYLAFKIFPRRKWEAGGISVELTGDEPKAETETAAAPIAQVTESKVMQVGIADIDKRAFLKLIGGAGIALFLYSIFSRKAEGLFFKNSAGSASGVVAIADTSGKKIDPALNHPTDGYRISEIDDNAVTFYGFTNKDGLWFIMKEDTDTGSFRYSKGEKDFPGRWNERENLKYDYYDNVF